MLGARALRAEPSRFWDLARVVHSWSERYKQKIMLAVDLLASGSSYGGDYTVLHPSAGASRVLHQRAQPGWARLSRPPQGVVRVFHQVPVLPVVVPVAAAAFAALLWSVQRREQLSVPRAAVALALCVYFAGVVANTVFPIFVDKPSSDQPWYSHMALVPLVNYEIADAVMNSLVFVPLGMLVPLFLGRASWWRVLALASLLSLMIEVAQYTTAHLLGGGHVADVNDLLFNVAGAALGYALFAVLSRPPGASAVIDRFRWR